MVAKEGIIDEAQVQAFQAGLRGQLIRPSDSNYDEARAVYNGMIDKRPALIARCANAGDVIRNALDHAPLSDQRRTAAGG
jgi:hypothetical protein